MCENWNIIIQLHVTFKHKMTILHLFCVITRNHRKTGVNGVWTGIFEWTIVNRL